MKLLIEIDIKKVSGKTCDPDEVAEVIYEVLDGVTFYPQNADADDESEYEVTDSRLVTK